MEHLRIDVPVRNFQIYVAALIFLKSLFLSPCLGDTKLEKCEEENKS